MLDGVIRLDKENRKLLLSALQQQAIAFLEPVVPSVPAAIPSAPFTNMLKTVKGSVNNTKRFIQQQCTRAGIPFELFIPKTGNENPNQ